MQWSVPAKMRSSQTSRDRQERNGKESGRGKHDVGIKQKEIECEWERYWEYEETTGDYRIETHLSDYDQMTWMRSHWKLFRFYIIINNLKTYIKLRILILK